MRRPSTDQLLSTSARSSANGSARESQFSSTVLPLTSSAPGRIRASASLQSAGIGNPSASRSRTMLSRPSQSSSMPFSNASRAPGKIALLLSLQSTLEAKPSSSPSLAPSHSAMMSMKSLRTMSLSAPQEMRSRCRRAPRSCRCRPGRSSRRRPLDRRVCHSRRRRRVRRCPCRRTACRCRRRRRRDRSPERGDGQPSFPRAEVDLDARPPRAGDPLTLAHRGAPAGLVEPAAFALVIVVVRALPDLDLVGGVLSPVIRISGMFWSTSTVAAPRAEAGRRAGAKRATAMQQRARRIQADPLLFAQRVQPWEHAPWTAPGSSVPSATAPWSARRRARSRPRSTCFNSNAPPGTPRSPARSSPARPTPPPGATRSRLSCGRGWGGLRALVAAVRHRVRPCGGTMTIVVKCKFWFEDGDRALWEGEEDAGPDSHLWGPAEILQWKADFKRKVSNAWSGKHTFHCTRDGWEDLRRPCGCGSSSPRRKPTRTTCSTSSSSPSWGIGGRARSRALEEERDHDTPGQATLDSQDLEQYDGQTPAYHEAGHMLGLGDEYPNKKNKEADRAREARASRVPQGRPARQG